ncbi:MAG: histidinol dehydrogenase [Syntrophaceae bacterium]|nr:histidinol dehydrogenase [Syntrophaceae bacterium]
MERRGVQEGVRLEQEVRSILVNVRRNGDHALIHYTRLFDGVKIRAERIRVRRDEIDRAYEKVPHDFLGTLKKAARRIQRFHRSVSRGTLFQQIKEDEDGIRLGQMIRPLERVGIYVPGGKASYPSTVLMAAIPAKVAGVQRVVMTTPPQREGISPAILVAADLAGVDEIYRAGGAQAIGALAYGTSSIPRVDKIVGPGNRYVAMAKRLVYGAVDIDMVAGPSEIVIIADGKTPASFVAADLISQAEHDEMAVAILITISKEYGEEVRRELKRQLPSLKREKIAYESLTRRGAILIVNNLDQAVELANRIAPEHLELSLLNARSLLKKLRHAGALFLGAYTAEAIGDYMAGPNHILPTAGTARFSSPLGVEDFIKRTNVMSFTQGALRRFEKDVKRFTEWEGLEGHYRSIQVRMKK